MDRDEKIYIHEDTVKNLRKKILEALRQYHSAYPLKPGISKEELRSKFPSVKNPKLMTLMLNRMIHENELIQDEKIIHLASHTVSLGADQDTIRKKIEAAYAATGLMPPYFRDLVKTLDTNESTARDVLNLLVQDRKLIKVKEDLYFHAEAVEKLRQELVSFLKAREEITTAEFKDMTGASRKYVIPLFEYFDARNTTIRIGDIRKLRKG